MRIVKPAYVNSQNRTKESKIYGVYSIDIHPNGKKYATCGAGDSNGIISVWNIEPLRHSSKHKDENISKLLFKDTSHIKCVNVVRWSPNGTYLASGSMDALVTIWVQRKVSELNRKAKNQENYRIAYHLKGHEHDVFDLAWSPNGAYLCSAGVDNKIIIWNGCSFDKIAALNGHNKIVKGLAWDPVGQYLASQGEDSKIIIWRIKDWKKEIAISERIDDQSTNVTFSRLSWAPDGSSILAPCTKNGGAPTCQFYERETWKCSLDIIGHRQHLLFAKFFPAILKSPDDKEYELVVLGGRDRSLSLWTTLQNRPVKIIADLFSDTLFDASWNVENLELMIASLDGNIAYIKLDSKVFGKPFTPTQMQARLESKYGKAVIDELMKGGIHAKNLVNSEGGSNGGEIFIPESANVHELVKEGRADLETDQFSFDKINRLFNVRNDRKPTGPKEQIVQTTKNGKKRITPRFVSHLDGDDIEPDSPQVPTEEKQTIEKPVVNSLRNCNADSDLAMDTSDPTADNKPDDKSDTHKELNSQVTCEKEDLAMDSDLNSISDEIKSKSDCSKSTSQEIKHKKTDSEDTDTASDSRSIVSSKKSISSTPVTTSITTLPTSITSTSSCSQDDKKLDKLKTRLGETAISSSTNGIAATPNSAVVAVPTMTSLVDTSVSSLKTKCPLITVTPGLIQKPTSSVNTTQNGAASASSSKPTQSVNLPDNSKQKGGDKKGVRQGLCFMPQLSKEFQVVVDKKEKGFCLVTVLSSQSSQETEENFTRLWDCCITSNITAIMGYDQNLYIGDELGRLHVFSCQKGRLESPILLNSGPITYISTSPYTNKSHYYLITVSKNAKMIIWKISSFDWTAPTFVMTNDISELVGSRNSGPVTVKNIRLEFSYLDSMQKEEMRIFVYFNEGSIFMYSNVTCYWKALLDGRDECALWALDQINTCTSKHLFRSKIDQNKVADIQLGGLKRSHSSSNNSSSIPAIGLHRASLMIDQTFHQLKHAEALSSQSEYRYWLQRYVKLLVERNEIHRVRNVFTDLIGPMFVSSNSTWSPKIMNLDKRELARNMLGLLSKNNKLQSLYAEFDQLLKLIDSS